MENSSPGSKALSDSKHKIFRAAEDTPGHPYGAGTWDPKPMECLQSCRVTEPWEKVPMYQLSVLRKANNSPDLPSAAVHVQASFLHSLYHKYRETLLISS